MKVIYRLTLPTMFALIAAGCAPSDGGESEGTPRDSGPDTTATVIPDLTPVIIMETTMGRLVMELDRERAPESVDNFLRYVRGKFYDGLIFHRVEPRLVQVGLYTADRQRRTVQSAVPLVNEAENGLKNVRGAVAMARRTNPHSAVNQFFINVRDNPTFDFTEKTARGWGYAVFGHITEGMDVLDALVQVPTSRQGSFQAPVDPVVIVRAYVADKGGS